MRKSQTLGGNWEKFYKQSFQVLSGHPILSNWWKKFSGFLGSDSVCKFGQDKVYFRIGENFSWVFMEDSVFRFCLDFAYFHIVRFFIGNFMGFQKKDSVFSFVGTLNIFILAKFFLGISLGFPNYDSLGFGDSLLLLLVACGSLIVFLLYSAVSWNRNRNWLISSFVHFLLFSFSLLPCSPVLQGH